MSSNQTLGSTPDYTMGYGETYLEFLSSIEVSEAAGHLTPYLKPGLSLLDLGCGPGFISVSLAELIVPGELYGIDMEPSQVAIASQIAEEHGCENTEFRVADAAELPFADQFFDVVHCCDILAYIPDTAAVLEEVKRVLKPGGIISCREMIIDSSFVHPGREILTMGWNAFADLLLSDDGHPQMGKEVNAHLLEAGFYDVKLSATFEIYSGPERVEMFNKLIQGWFMSADIVEPAEKYGAASATRMTQIGKAVDDWRQTPGAFAAIAYGQAIATRPY